MNTKSPGPRRHLYLLALLLLATPLLMGFSFLEALLAPKAELWPRWQAHDAASTASIDHGAWTAFLRETVVSGEDGIHRVRYSAVTPAQHAALAAYLERLQALPISAYNRAEQHAYWINLYNALTVRLILEHLPLESIRDIDAPWGTPLAAVEGQPLTLNDIEHRILRPIWQDPRTHYAVNCASLGCPNLATRAYTAADLEAMLKQGAHAYINHPRGARVVDGELTVSSIYNWFEPDFGGSEWAVIAHLRRHADSPLAQALEGIGSIDGYAYDWALNSLP